MSEPAQLTIGKILVPLDFEAPSLHALDYAKDLSQRFGASLQVLHVIPNPYLPSAYLPLVTDIPIISPSSLEDLAQEARKRLEEVLPKAAREALRATTSIKVGDARTVILEHANEQQIDLIVMGTHGRKGAAHLLLGSVAERIVRAAPCPVLTVR